MVVVRVWELMFLFLAVQKAKIQEQKFKEGFKDYTLTATVCVLSSKLQIVSHFTRFGLFFTAISFGNSRIMARRRWSSKDLFCAVQHTYNAGRSGKNVNSSIGKMLFILILHVSFKKFTKNNPFTRPRLCKTH